MSNKLREAWRAGRPTVNGWLSIPNGFTAEVVAAAGWDSLTVDLQHGMQDLASMLACFQGMQRHDPLPMARVPTCEASIIGKVLDAGAYGIICPMINSPAEAEALVAACRYPPDGQRSNGPTRIRTQRDVGEYQRAANDEVLCIPMIETAQALESIDAILAVPGLDAVYIGPSDLAWSLGLPPRQDSRDPDALRAFELILTKAREHGLPAGMHTVSPEYATFALDMGFDLVTVGSDVAFLAAGAAAATQVKRHEPVRPPKR